ncbi:MAG: hypothetical protein WCE80_14255 [Acidimicrobiia bacterium]
MILVGVLLVLGLGASLVGNLSLGAGYNSAFWRLPLDEKLDHIFTQRRAWWWMSLWELVGLFAMTGGMAGLTWLLVDGGEPVLASVAVGGYVVALIPWLFGLTFQTAGVARAARSRGETGRTPDWLQPLWDTAYLGEIIWIVASNLAHAVFGLALVQTGLVASWVGWLVFGLALGVIAIVAIVRDGFPQLGSLAPLIIGIALLAS